jgi:hypothetical protein
MAKPFDRSWSEYAGRYSQNEPEDKEAFADNWRNLFGKSRLERLLEEQQNANHEDNNARPQQKDGL